MTDTVQATTRVPDDETPAACCPHCDRPFARERLRDLHLGKAHPGEVTDREREAYERAADEEGDDLFLYHLRVIAVLVVLYAATIIVYMVVLSGGV
ncbi:hypothetical protein ACFR9U_13705 [Halorientalis brevis]|uniref:C2H2-type domain-containing protein n=1 Tax=Halorientalis brevis TaxID=1126241 RepID=A0ABD6CDM9_9EURY|nr:DNA-binding protein [Halorientalis brevis]